MIKNRVLFVVLTVLCLHLSSSGNASDTPPQWHGIQYNTGRLAQLSAFQNNGAFFSGVALWTPSYAFSNGFALGLDLGTSVLRIHSHHDFVAPEYVLKGSYAVNNSISVDAGVGAQTWINNGGTYLQVEANGAYHLTDKLLYFIDQFFVGYTFINSSIQVTHEIRIGAGLSF